MKMQKISFIVGDFGILFLLIRKLGVMVVQSVPCVHVSGASVAY